MPYEARVVCRDKYRNWKDVAVTHRTAVARPPQEIAGTNGYLIAAAENRLASSGTVAYCRFAIVLFTTTEHRSWVDADPRTLVSELINRVTGLLTAQAVEAVRQPLISVRR